MNFTFKSGTIVYLDNQGRYPATLSQDCLMAVAGSPNEQALAEQLMATAPDNFALNQASLAYTLGDNRIEFTGRAAPLDVHSSSPSASTSSSPSTSTSLSPSTSVSSSPSSSVSRSVSLSPSASASPSSSVSSSPSASVSPSASASRSPSSSASPSASPSAS